MEDLTGQSLSHYNILRKIGSGGMGVVYEAEDTALGRHVALKFLPEELAREEDSLERFRREARASSALNHPNICTVYAIESHDRQQFIAMELLEGQTLSALMSTGPIGIERLLPMATQIADALESAHAKGIVHRDIKPANIFVNARDQVKVLDFGLAKMEMAKRSAGADEATDLQTQAQNLTAIGTAMGTASYMSPEQARGELADARTDLFSLGTVLYQMASGTMPFAGDTTAVVYDAILNRMPPPLSEVRPELPAELWRIVEKALEKDRSIRYQSATDLKTDLIRLQRSLDSGKQSTTSSNPAAQPAESMKPEADSVAVLYFENLSGVKEDEYFRDGITEDIITELSKIKELNVFSRHAVLPSRESSISPTEMGKRLRAAHVLTGSLRRAGNRLRINAQLIDTQTDFPVWSERYDRELEDVFEVQDEIAQKIAGALRITLTPQEEAEIRSKPTENLQAYDLYLRGKSYARRLTRQDLEFALQMFENAVVQDPEFALGYAAIANVCAQNYYHYLRETTWIGRAMAASQKAVALQPDQPEVLVAQAWILYASNQYDDAIASVKRAIELKSDCEGAYYLLGRALFASGHYQELVDIRLSRRSDCALMPSKNRTRLSWSSIAPRNSVSALALIELSGVLSSCETFATKSRRSDSSRRSSVVSCSTTIAPVDGSSDSGVTWTDRTRSSQSTSSRWGAPEAMAERVALCRWWLRTASSSGRPCACDGRNPKSLPAAAFAKRTRWPSSIATTPSIMPPRTVA